MDDFKKKRHTRAITFRLDEDLYNRFYELCRRNDLSKTKIIVSALEDFCDDLELYENRQTEHEDDK